MTATQHKPAAHDPHAAPIAPLRIALVADDELSTRGVASILREHREHFQLVTMASRDSAPIDIALYDHALGGASRLDRLAELLSDARVRKVAIFTASFEPSRALEFTGQGACAYLSKSMTGAEIVDALKKVSAGQVVVPSHDKSALYGQVLTPREAQVLLHIASGLSNAEIANTLDVSINSVKSYIRACYRKIDVDSRSKAVLWALSHGLGGASSKVVNGRSTRVAVP